MTKKGFGLIEIVIALSIVSGSILGIFWLAYVSFNLLGESNRRSQAAYLAEEGLEVIRILRDESWSGNVETLVSGSNYYFVFDDVSRTWSVTDVDPGQVFNIFSRRVVIHDVLRDANSDIAQVGALDPDTRRVEVEVSWPERGDTEEVVLETYLTNLFSN